MFPAGLPLSGIRIGELCGSSPAACLRFLVVVLMGRSHFHLVSALGSLLVAPLWKSRDPALGADEDPYHHCSQCQYSRSDTNAYPSFGSVCHI